MTSAWGRSFDLALSAFEDDKRLCLMLDANAHLFLDSTVQRMMGHLQVGGPVWQSPAVALHSARGEARMSAEANSPAGTRTRKQRASASSQAPCCSQKSCATVLIGRGRLTGAPVVQVLLASAAENPDALLTTLSMVEPAEVEQVNSSSSRLLVKPCLMCPGHRLGICQAAA